MSCGLATETDVRFYNFCTMRKKHKMTAYGYNFQYGCALTVANMTSQVTCFPALLMHGVISPPDTTAYDRFNNEKHQ